MEFVLKTPSATDAHLIAVINDPSLEVRPIGNQTTTGEMYFDLIALGRHVRVKVICHTVSTTKK